ncbi:MAG: NAD(P)H-dependent glycerol-3-phosphate dehydrogenase [Cyanobacteriota bacterium]|nr:NAD(P)H-dependent glycerol-3-phosphate dehydrogenase [Cyanobacteriota bacterium]
MTLRIALLGRGAWGRTLMGLWQAQGHLVNSWSRSDGTDPATALQEADLVVSAVAMAGVLPLARQLQERWPQDLALLSCSKGIELQSLATASQLWDQGLGGRARLAVLSGPNLARELDLGLPAASTVASRDASLCSWLQDGLSGETLRLYRHDDPIGCEAAGALKNVIAIAAGICDGLQLGANAKASLLCRGLAEMAQLLQGLGGHSATLYGLAGVGDLLATANSPLSRNYRFGLLLAEGRDAGAALAEIAATVEGQATAAAALALARRHGWHLPICEQVHAVIAGQILPQQAVRALMGRELKAEGKPGTPP